jgi:signal transduction histidine kinase
MAEALWARRPRPDRTAGGVPLGRWRPIRPADLTASRRQLHHALHAAARAPEGEDGAVERLLLAFEELASNALRHGRAPVEVAVTRTGSSWLLEVSDAAADVPPMPELDRDAALGGLGLPLVARLSAAHGWTVEGTRKVVWARIEVGADGLPAAGPG